MGIINKLHHQLRELAHTITRPSAVNRAQHQHVVANPSCAACGGLSHCQGHHISPYHKDPDRAADPANFITLCMGDDECHLKIGHGGSFRSYNPHVVANAAMALTAGPVGRATVEQAAKAQRLPDEP